MTAGSNAIEYLGFLPVLILVGMAAVQLGLIAYTAQQAGTGARAGARTRLARTPARQRTARGKAR